MKILTGTLQGRIIRYKPNPYLRPTSDKVRKALFDSLQGAIAGKSVLDLFSGTGALGMEALSMGAGHVTFVEKNAKQAQTIQENLESLGLFEQSSIETNDVFDAISKLSYSDVPYDIIFVDPPYKKGLAVQTLEALSVSSLLRKGSLIFLECSNKESLPDALRMLTCVRTRFYGDTQVAVYVCGSMKG